MTSMWKALILRAIGLFLFWFWISGKLSLYIHERFAVLTLLAAFGLLLIGGVYHGLRVREPHSHQHQHGQFSWGGLFLVLLPIVFGLMVPRVPLGSEAMRTRNVSMASMMSLAAPDSKRQLRKPVRKRTILDWVMMFLVDRPEAFVGEAAHVSGFVYYDEDFPENSFMVARFVVTCCAADASPVGLYVSWPEGKKPISDQWVEVSGHFEMQEVKKEQTPVLIAETITLIDVPAQPYLYP